MGFGFLESVYEKCLLIELRKAGLIAESQKPITVTYEDEIVGEFVADIVVENTIILELKSVRDLEIINIPVIISSCFVMKGGYGHEDISFDSEWSDNFNC